VPDELAWLAKLAGRFDVGLSPYAAVVFEELSARIYDGLGLDEVGEQAPLARRAPYVAPPAAPVALSPEAKVPADEHLVGTLRLLRYRPLFSGHEVERVPELQFQRPEREVAISSGDAHRRGIASGDLVSLRSNGTSVELRARVDRRLVEGVARVAEEHAGELHLDVEVVRA
jgi:anaerobic selenocysteine-containing dehydrogenase